MPAHFKFHQKSYLLFLLLVALNRLGNAEEIPYFSNLTIEDAEKTRNVEHARDLVGVGPHLIEIDNRSFFHSRVVLRAHYFKAENPKALVLGVHGLQSNARWFMRTGTYLAKRGISVLIYDRRGSGLSDGNIPLSRKIFGILDDFDPNSDEIKLAKGLRGDVRTGFLFRRLVFNAPSQFMVDIKAAMKKLRYLNREERQPNGKELDIHILANCFGSRIAFPYSFENSHVKSLIITAPATDMHPRADITSLFKKVDIALPIFHILGPKDYVSTPLKDSYFVSPSNPAYENIRNDAVSLSLRFGTADFFFATNSLHKKMLKLIPKMKTPLLVALGNRDKMVINDYIRNRFVSQYPGPGTLLTFDSEHMLEFSPAGESFSESVLRWIESDLRTENPRAFRSSDLKYRLNREDFGNN